MAVALCPIERWRVPAYPLRNGVPVQLPRVLSTDVARRLGLSRSAIRHAIARRGWRRLVPGVVLTAPDGPTRADWAVVGMTLASKRAALSGWDAVRFHGISGPAPPDARILVLDRTGRHRRAGNTWIRPTSRSYQCSRLSPVHPTLPDVAVVAPARAIADTALLYRRLGPVRAMVTAGLQRGLYSADDLAAELAACPRNNSGLLRRSMLDVADNAHSIAEARALDYLRRVAIPQFECNVEIVDSHGTLVAIADVLWRELRAVLEIDSVEFHFDEASWKATGARHNTLTRFGLAVAHYPPSQIRDGGLEWAREIETWLRYRASELGVDYRVRPEAVRHGPGGAPAYTLRL